MGLALGCLGDDECLGDTVRCPCFDDDDDEDEDDLDDLGTGLDDFPDEEELWDLFGELPVLDECFLGGGEAPCFILIGLPPPSRPPSRPLSRSPSPAWSGRRGTHLYAASSLIAPYPCAPSCADRPGDCWESV